MSALDFSGMNPRHFGYRAVRLKNCIITCGWQSILLENQLDCKGLIIYLNSLTVYLIEQLP